MKLSVVIPRYNEKDTIREKGYKICEVPIKYNPRSYEEGKKIKKKDGVIAIWSLLKYRFVD